MKDKDLGLFVGLGGILGFCWDFRVFVKGYSVTLR